MFNTKAIRYFRDLGIAQENTVLPKKNSKILPKKIPHSWISHWENIAQITEKTQGFSPRGWS